MSTYLIKSKLIDKKDTKIYYDAGSIVTAKNRKEAILKYKGSNDKFHCNITVVQQLKP